MKPLPGLYKAYPLSAWDDTITTLFLLRFGYEPECIIRDGTDAWAGPLCEGTEMREGERFVTRGEGR